MLLDIGAVWCHWCHVMDGESYENPAPGRVPQPALHLHQGRSGRAAGRGCPVPARDPGVDAARAAGPSPRSSHRPARCSTAAPTSRPMACTGARASARCWRACWTPTARAAGKSVAGGGGAARGGRRSGRGGGGRAGARQLDDAVTQMARVFDPVNGGFGRAPKFPHPGAMTLLLHRWCGPARRARARHPRPHAPRHGARRGLRPVRRRISPLQRGRGVDRPALREDVLRQLGAAQGLRSTPTVLRVRGVRERGAGHRAVGAGDGSDPEGGYAASQDADVGLDDDGDYFTWTRDEAAAVLTAEELEVAAALLRHRHRGRDAPQSRQERALRGRHRRRSSPPASAGRSSRSGRPRARERPAPRRSGHPPRPFVDRTRYANWNAMMASALLKAGAVLGDEDARRHAIVTLERLRRERVAEDAVAHTPGGVTGLLDDQVQVAAAALDAHETTGEVEWLAWAERLMDRVWTDYWDEAKGGLFDTARARDAGPGPAAGAGQAGAGRAHAVAQRRGRYRVRATARADGRRALAGSRPGVAACLRRPRRRARPLRRGVPAGGRLAHVPRHASRDRRRAGRSRRRPDARRRAGDVRAPPRRPPARAGRPAGPDPPPAMAGMVAAGRAPRGYACTGTSCRAPADTVEAWSAVLDELIPRAT